MKKIMMFLMTLINLMFLNFNNPMIMGILLMIQTILLIMIMGKIYYTFWFSYIMFLVFIGGLFILFIYIISLVYNNKFYLMNNFFFMFFLLIIFMIMIKKKIFFFNYETNMMINKLLNIKENYLNTLKFYNFPNNYINLLLILYLLMMMIIVVKITNFFMGPIRSMN